MTRIEKDDYDRIKRFNSRKKYFIEMDKIISLMNFAEDDIVLDIACGTGTATHYISNKTGCRIVGIDLNHIQYTKHSKKVRFCEMNAEKIMFKDDLFDKLLIIHSIEHFENIDRVMEHSMRLLKPGGKIAVITPNNKFVATYYIPNFFNGYEKNDTTEKFFSVRKLRKLFKKHGFKIEILKTYGKHALGFLPLKERIILIAKKPIGV